MAVVTSRTKESGVVEIDKTKCNLCGLCADLCSMLRKEDNEIIFKNDAFIECFSCGQCAAFCPKQALTVTERCFDSKKDLLDFEGDTTSFKETYNLFLKRRSIRHFKMAEVEKDLIDKIIMAAETAPMGIPPSEVKILIINGKDKVRAFSFEFLGAIKKMKWVFSLLKLLSPLMKKQKAQVFNSFVIPLYEELLSKKEKGIDALLYDAPLAMYFYKTPYTEDGDVMIAATYAMIAAESLGLGSCMIGSMGPFMKQMPKAFKEKYGITEQDPGGLVLILGYPKFKFQRGIKRTFAEVRMI